MEPVPTSIEGGILSNRSPNARRRRAGRSHPGAPSSKGRRGRLGLRAGCVTKRTLLRRQLGYGRLLGTQFARPEGDAYTISDETGRITFRVPARRFVSLRPEIDCAQLRMMLLSSLAPPTVQWGRVLSACLMRMQGNASISRMVPRPMSTSWWARTAPAPAVQPRARALPAACVLRKRGGASEINGHRPGSSRERPRRRFRSLSR